ncbi:hypothetical protein Glove_84g173 [Diversispora epigaea]|uniref:Uncharacterized protein n=1 Tax=Diversispora epigaea TaxID=1348612 RepID=A0A397J7A6_9GLOM|nr:hypothetical protein Glove_84g173 [Diversispora epigaea]
MSKKVIENTKDSIKNNVKENVKEGIENHITPNYYLGKRRIEDTKSQKSIASAHIERLLPYHSCKVYPPALAEIVRSSAHVPNLLPYHSYKVAVTDAEDLARPRLVKFPIKTPPNASTTHLLPSYIP